MVLYLCHGEMGSNCEMCQLVLPRQAFDTERFGVKSDEFATLDNQAKQEIPVGACDNPCVQAIGVWVAVVLV